MPLLALDHVTVQRSRGRRRRPADAILHETSLELDAGESVAIWGMRRSGRTTFLSVAAGLRPPDEGTVTFAGVDLAQRPMLGVSDGIGYAITQFDPVLADTAREHVATPLLGSGCPPPDAEAQADRVLERVGAGGCGDLVPAVLDAAETMRVAIARALVTRPSLLVLDEPTLGLPPARRRDDLLALVDAIAHQDGIAVLMTAGETTDLAGVDRALTLDGGRLRGPATPATGQVLLLRAAVSGGRGPAADETSPGARRG